jgi:hypothetical protein
MATMTRGKNACPIAVGDKIALAVEMVTYAEDENAKDIRPVFTVVAPGQGSVEGVVTRAGINIGVVADLKEPDETIDDGEGGQIIVPGKVTIHRFSLPIGAALVGHIAVAKEQANDPAQGAGSIGSGEEGGEGETSRQET